ncbi:CRISPR-associated endonuclease Cas1, partial [Archaeoglobus sp.]
MKLIINGWGTFLGVKDGMIRVTRDGKEKEIAAGNVEAVILATKGIVVSSAFLRLAADNNIDVVVLNSNGRPIGRYSPLTKKGNVKVRKEQYAAQNDERGFHLAKSFARGKIMNQYYLLKSLAKNRGQKDILDLCYKIKERAARIDRLDEYDKAKIIGEEAKAAEVYWKGVS